MARLSSLERWSATMMWSANRLVTERNRSRIHASLRTGVTTTTRTGSDTVLRYDGASERETVRGEAFAAPDLALDIVVGEAREEDRCRNSWSGPSSTTSRDQVSPSCA